MPTRLGQSFRPIWRGIPPLIACYSGSGVFVAITPVDSSSRPPTACLNERHKHCKPVFNCKSVREK